MKFILPSTITCTINTTNNLRSVFIILTCGGHIMWQLHLALIGTRLNMTERVTIFLLQLVADWGCLSEAAGYKEDPLVLVETLRFPARDNKRSASTWAWSYGRTAYSDHLVRGLGSICPWSFFTVSMRHFIPVTEDSLMATYNTVRHLTHRPPKSILLRYFPRIETTHCCICLSWRKSC